MRKETIVLIFAFFSTSLFGYLLGSRSSEKEKRYDELMAQMRRQITPDYTGSQDVDVYITHLNGEFHFQFEQIIKNSGKKKIMSVVTFGDEK